MADATQQGKQVRVVLMTCGDGYRRIVKHEVTGAGLIPRETVDRAAVNARVQVGPIRPSLNVKPNARAREGEIERAGFIAPQQWTAIQDAIERTKNYPRLARERGIEGEVRLRFRLNSAGIVESVEVVKSSGYEILDNLNKNNN